MNAYETIAGAELEVWKQRMRSKPSLINRLSKRMQTKINSWIPEKVHVAITAAIKQMTRAVCYGVEFVTPDPLRGLDLQQVERNVDSKIVIYSRTAAAEGAVTGAGGFVLGLADFPLWLMVKMKMLFDIGACYGYDIRNYKERVFLLHIFEMTFSSQQTVYSRQQY